MTRGDSNNQLDPVFAAANAAYLPLSKLKEPQDREQALRFVAERLGVQPGNLGGASGAAANRGAGGAAPAASDAGVTGTAGTLTPKQFMAQKGPRKQIHRIACLAYYLSHYRSMPQYRTADLTALNTEAQQPRFTSASVHVDNAVNAQLLASVGGGMKAITTRAEAVVEALPDRGKVKQVLEQHGKVTRRRKKKKANRRTKGN